MGPDAERSLREQLAEAHFHNKVLTWIAAFFFAVSLLLLAYR